MSEFAPSKEKQAAIAAIMACESFALVTETNVDAKDDENKEYKYANWELWSNDDGLMKLGGMLTFGAELWKRNMMPKKSDDDSNNYY